MVRIAIIGGGIGGLTTAIALRQAGFEPEVYEQAPALLDVGAAIAIWPNAMRVLVRLGLADKILEKAGIMDEIRWLDQKGWLINRVSISETSEDRKVLADGASEEALRNYEHCRYHRTAAVSKYSRYYGNIGQWENILARAFRKTTLTLVPESLARRLMQIVFAYDATKVSV